MKNIMFCAIAIMAMPCAKAQPDSDIKILGLVQSLEAAWNQKDAEMFAKNFCEEHDFIVWNGMYSPNITIEANKSGHKFLFTELDQQNTNVKYVVDKVRYLSDSIALVHILGSTYEKDRDPMPYPTQIQTWIVVNTDQSWKIKSLHSADIEYDIFIHNEPCPAIPTTEEEKMTYARQFYKSYSGSLK